MTEQPGPGAGQQQEQQQQPAAPPPAAQPPAAPVQREGIKNRESGFVWALAFFTGIYGVIWYYQLCKELGEWGRGRIDTDPVMSTVAITIGSLVIVPVFVSWAGTLGRIRAAQEMAGLEPRATFWGGFGRTLLFGYSYYWLQEQLNELSERQPA